jgi:hypothetical protein
MTTPRPPQPDPPRRPDRHAHPRETGELYGQAIAPTGDIDDDGKRGIQEYDEDDGQNWLEALEQSAAENGPAGAAAITSVHGTEADDERPDKDDPPADHGAGGSGGL